MSDQLTNELPQTTYTYKVVRGSIKLPRPGGSKFISRSQFVNQGELLPDGIFSSADIQSWLQDGRIELISDQDAPLLQSARVEHRGKWTVDPSVIAGKSMETLLLMVLEIDPQYDTDSLENEGDVARLLTSDWKPSYASTVPAANDRSRPKAMKLHDMSQTEGVPATSMVSDESGDSLARARALAAAPQIEE